MPASLRCLGPGPHMAAGDVYADRGQAAAPNAGRAGGLLEGQEEGQKGDSLHVRDCYSDQICVHCDIECVRLCC